MNVNFPSNGVPLTASVQQFFKNSTLLPTVDGEIEKSFTYAGIGNTTGGASRGISGRKNANGLDDNFTGWLDGLISGDNESYMYEDNGVYYFNYDNLYELYQEAIKNGASKVVGEEDLQLNI